MHLFKYFDPARLDVITKGCIRLTQPVDFNDPFELKPKTSTSGINEAIANISSTVTYLPRTKLDCENRAISISKKLFAQKQQVTVNVKNSATDIVASTQNKSAGELIGVLCLAEEPDNLIMWSHYAKAHQGFCVKFDTSNYFFNQKRTMQDQFYHLRRVEYCEEMPTKVIQHHVGVDLLLHKSDTWSYEKEWRFCAVLHDSDQRIECADSDIHLFKYPKEMIKEIILGVNASDALAEQIKSIIADTPEFSNIKLFKAYIVEKSYRLAFKSL